MTGRRQISRALALTTTASLYLLYTLHFSDVISNFRVVAAEIFRSTYLQAIFRSICNVCTHVCVVDVFLCPKSHMSKSIFPLVAAITPKYNKNFRSAAMLLFYILKTYYFKKNCVFSWPKSERR